MKVKEASFIKKNGELRTMFYVSLRDLPYGFLPERKTTREKKIKASENPDLELVWDIREGGYRYVNHARLVPKQHW